MNKFEKIFLVTCVKGKKPNPAPAKDLYDSELFENLRKYVEPFNMPWFILSEEYGLLHPDKEIKPYEKALKDMTTDEHREWAKRVISQMENDLPDADEVIILAGVDYRKYLLGYLEKRYEKVSIPMEGLRIGEQVEWLQKQIAISTS